MSRLLGALLLAVGLLSATAGAMTGAGAEDAARCYDYRYGEQGAPIDYRQTRTYCQRAAEAGDANAQTLLAELYFLGLGQPQDFAQALRWYGEAARQGHSHAQLMLYEMNRLGLATARDPEQARFWLQQAAAQGHPQALTRLQP